MSGLPSYRAYPYRQASDLPQEFWNVLMRNEAAANIILPFARKALSFTCQSGNDQLWIILYDDTSNNVEFVLSCTCGPLGNYPIFVYTPKSSTQLALEGEDGKDITIPLSQLVHCLLQEAQILPRRVFSVFSIAKVAEKLAEILEQIHGLKAIKKPYYDATFTFCTRSTLSGSPIPFPPPGPEDISIALRRATTADLEGLRVICQQFSSTSPPYELDDARAKMEAEMLINNQQAWVHMMKKGDDEWDIACLVAATRESENVTTVTKVFTAKKWRSHGCAARLLHRVCEEILQNKNRIVLYVGTELGPARKVYHKIGFQGLDPQQEQRVEGVERWVEIGFNETDLGYW